MVAVATRPGRRRRGRAVLGVRLDGGGEAVGAHVDQPDEEEEAEDGAEDDSRHGAWCEVAGAGVGGGDDEGCFGFLSWDHGGDLVGRGRGRELACDGREVGGRRWEGEEEAVEDVGRELATEQGVKWRRHDGRLGGFFFSSNLA